jgi:cysteine desulfurase/selenocysteine lyase
VTQNYRALFEFNPEIIYLNHASTGMLPQRTVKAMTEYIEALAFAGEHAIEGLLAMQADFREHASKLLNVQPGEIAFIRNTSDGLALALHSIDWQPGDNMIVQEDAFPACLYIAAYCFPRVEKRYVPLKNGVDFYHRLQQQIDEHTRAVVVDYVHFLSGYRLDLQQFSQLKQHKNFYLIVDGIQGLGAVQVDLKNTAVDFFSAGGVKWLNAPAGTGILYVRQAILEELIPFQVGWASAEYEDLSSFYPVRPLYKDARRFQPANDNFIGMMGLTESIKLIHGITPHTIVTNIMQKTTKVIDTLESHGYSVLTPQDHTFRAGIVTFKHPQIESKKLFERLKQKHVICSLREGWIRLAFHFYNTVAEFDEVFSVLQSTAKKQ